MIKFLVMDVDGTLTDGKIYMGADGEMFKAFDIKDGYALHTLLKEMNIVPVIITARKSPMVEHRCKELGVKEIHQGIMGKLDCLEKILQKYSSEEQHYSLSNVAYIGDDLLDLMCMLPIKEAGGLVGCPANAVKEVLQVSDYVTKHNAGEGAVREFVEYISNLPYKIILSRDLINRINSVVEYISKLDLINIKPGKYEVRADFYYTVQEYEAFSEENSVWESHNKYVDVQWLISGQEKLYITDIRNLQSRDDYDCDRDVIHYYPSSDQSSILLVPGSCAILFPKDAHRPARYLGIDCIVKKIVGKLRIS